MKRVEKHNYLKPEMKGIMEIHKPIRYAFLTIISLLLWHQSLNSQEIRFEKVPLPENKNIDFVTGITQDANGIMWFSTKAGLLRYDGSNMTIYENNPINPNSLVSNFAESVYADKGKIWIGTLGHGLDLFDPVSGIFTHFRYDPNDPTSLSNDTVTSLLRDQDGTMWIGTHGGLNQYNPETNDFSHFRSDSSDATSISNDQVRVLYEDRKGTLWVGTGSPYADNGGGPLAGGLNRMDKKTGTFTRYMHDPANKNSLSNNKIGAIYEDDKGVLWVGTAKNGLHKINKEKETIERLVYDPANPVTFSLPAVSAETVDYEHITFITQDQAGRYWVGTTESGVYYYNPVVRKSAHFHQMNNDSSGFTDRGAWATYTSRDGMLWMGSIVGNIYRINPARRDIPHFSAPNPVNSFYESPDGDLWIATEEKIIISEKRNETATPVVIDATPDNLQDDFVQIIKEDGAGNTWIGGSGGLALWDPENMKLIQYKHNPGKTNSLSNNAVITIYEDALENFWVGTIDGLNLMDRKQGTFKKYYLNQVDTSFIGRNIVTSVLLDSRGKLWVGTWNGSGVYELDPRTKSTRVYMSGSNIVCLYEDSDKVVWLGSNYGLFRYDSETDNFIRYLDPSSLSGIPFVYSIVEDDQKYLWISTNSRLARINPERNETNTLGEAYGLGNTEFKWNSSYKGKDGTLYFGDDAGYLAFNPAEVIRDAKSPEIVLTGFRLADQFIKPGDDSPLKQELILAKEIRLGYDQNVFSFDYALIDYVNPGENQLAYILENYDNNWQAANSEQRAYYFNVPPGSYTFRVRGANSFGIWAEKKITITILPPWWKTWWAYGIYALMLMLLVFGFDRIQRRRIRLIERQKNYKRELAQAKEIEKAYMELKTTQSQLIQAEKMASLGELTAGIAHEIQNPLNFVNNFSELNTELIQELEEERKKKTRDHENEDELIKNIKENEGKINHHGKRADSIVKGMLQHSRSSSGAKEPADINALADEYLRLAYHGLRAKDKSFNADFKADLDESLPKINVVAPDIGRVFLNLINNAFYAVDQKAKAGVKQPDLLSPENLTAQVSTSTKGDQNYKPLVSIRTKLEGNYLAISVKDNGDGIPAVVKEKIFQPFFTTKPTGEGTGLGLSMSYDIITKGHGGEIKIETEEGQGTSFTVLLPIKEQK